VLSEIRGTLCHLICLNTWIIFLCDLDVSFVIQQPPTCSSLLAAWRRSPMMPSESSQQFCQSKPLELERSREAGANLNKRGPFRSFLSFDITSKHHSPTQLSFKQHRQLFLPAQHLWVLRSSSQNLPLIPSSNFWPSQQIPSPLYVCSTSVRSTIAFQDVDRT
jgi:hypothetical protein